MDALADVASHAKASPLWGTYATASDPASAEEVLAARLEASAKVVVTAGHADEPHMTERDPHPRARRAGSPKRVKSILDSNASRQLQREVVRGLFGLLKGQIKRR
jgi:hypothetical protein